MTSTERVQKMREKRASSRLKTIEVVVDESTIHKANFLAKELGISRVRFISSLLIALMPTYTVIKGQLHQRSN